MADHDTDRRSDDSMTDDPDLDEVRAEIADIDEQLVALVAERTRLASEVAEAKAAAGLPTTDEEQEERVLERVGALADAKGIDPSYVQDVFRTLIELNKAEQRDKR